MTDLENMSVEELKETLLGLRKERHKLENDLSQTHSLSNPPVINKKAHNNQEMKTVLSGKALIDRTGVSVTQSKGKHGTDITIFKFLNWHRGELKGQASVKILIKEKEYSIVQHSIPHDVCSLISGKKLPIKFTDKDEQINVINTIKKSVSAYFNRLDQFNEFTEEYPHVRFVWESHCRNAELIIPLKLDKSFKVVVSMEYSEIGILPKSVSLSFSDDLDANFTEDFTKQLLILKEEYLSDAFKQILSADDEDKESKSSE
ncbi:uncharacterized protein LOC135942082 [Cloeon dipterum]|uniref:uncharacterized protein LOC135942082 n=1 Tax=Cloeon dipterum TaxID=197152 RepID=UPI00321FE6F6